MEKLIHALQILHHYKMFCLLWSPCLQNSEEKIIIHQNVMTTYLLKVVKISLKATQSSYPHLLEVGGEVLTLGDHGDVVVLALLLGQQLEPALHRALDNLAKNIEVENTLCTKKLILILS